jgi:hypothetical protein
MKKLSSLAATLFVAAGLVLGGGMTATAATAGSISQPDMNRCQYVTVPPKASGPMCWNLFGGFAKLPDACYATKVWKCYQV